MTNLRAPRSPVMGPCEECGTLTEVERVTIAPGDQYEEWYLCVDCRADWQQARRLGAHP